MNMHRQKEGKRVGTVKGICEFCKTHVKNMYSHLLAKHRGELREKTEAERKHGY